MLQGETLYHDVGSGIIISNQSLVVQRVTRIDSGRYTCHVFNSEGEGVSEEVSLSVKCKTLNSLNSFVCGMYGAVGGRKCLMNTRP